MKQVILVFILFMVLPTLQACGIPRDAYEIAIKEKNTAQADFQRVNGELEATRAELNKAKLEAKLQSGSPEAASTILSLAHKTALAEQILAFDSTRAQAVRMRNEIKDEEAAKKLDAQALTLLKSFDELVKSIGDSELSRAWAETFPPNVRQQAERDNRPAYVITGYIKLLDRLAALLEIDRNQLRTG